MNERELVNWLGEGHAQPGSVAFKHAELILSMKQREAKPTPDRLNEAHVNLILLPLGVFSVLWQVTGGSILAGSGGAVVTIALLALRPVRVLLVRLLNRVVG